MDLTCFNCKKTWDVSQAHILGAKLKYGLGFDEHGFICPNCDTKNYLTKQEFEAEMNEPEEAPSTGTGRAGTSGTVGGAKPGTDAGTATPRRSTGVPQTGPGLRRRGVVGRAGVAKPAPGPSFQARPREGVVIVRSLHVRKDHSTKAETMAGLVRGDKVSIINTWTDGENTWAQLGPDRWAAIVYNGEPLIELTN